MNRARARHCLLSPQSRLWQPIQVEGRHLDQVHVHLRVSIHLANILKRVLCSVQTRLQLDKLTLSRRQRVRGRVDRGHMVLQKMVQRGLQVSSREQHGVALFSVTLIDALLAAAFASLPARLTRSHSVARKLERIERKRKRWSSLKMRLTYYVPVSPHLAEKEAELSVPR